MSRYFQGQLRCEDSCLFGRTEQEVHDRVGLLHPTLSRDVFNHPTEGWVTMVETDGSSEPVVERVIGVSSSVRATSTDPQYYLWCSVYFDPDVGYFRPKFLSKETIKKILK